MATSEQQSVAETMGDGLIPTSKYVVVVYNEDTKIGTDVAEVEVPARTKRRRVIELAFEQAQIDPSSGDMKVRVLDEESAELIPAGWDEQPPKLRIG